MKPYEVIEHTADIGLQIYGKDLKELFVHGAQGLFDLMVDVEGVKKRRAEENHHKVGDSVNFRLRGEDIGDLFLKWLRELLYVFSTKRFVFDEFECKRLTEKQLEFQATAYVFIPKLHEVRTEIKAVTYHDFKIERRDEGWVARVIFDA